MPLLRLSSEIAIDARVDDLRAGSDRRRVSHRERAGRNPDRNDGGEVTVSITRVQPLCQLSIVRFAGKAREIEILRVKRDVRGGREAFSKGLREDGCRRGQELLRVKNQDSPRLLRRRDS